MNEFSGFPTRMQFTPVPNIFFSSVMPQIEDIYELKAVLHVFEILYRKKGALRYATLNELSASPSLLTGNISGQGFTAEKLKKVLEGAVKRGTLIHLAMDRGAAVEELYFLNNEANRQAVEHIRNGEIVVEGLKFMAAQPLNLNALPDIFTLYEQNIGMLTPLIAEELQDWQKQYPEAWVREAIKEAVALNKRNPRYIERILENWSTKGKGDGAYRGNSKKNPDPDKYIRGKYGHIVRR
jgi:DNA replication protein